LQFDLNSILNWANSATRFVKNNSGAALGILRSLSTGNWPAAAAQAFSAIASSRSLTYHLTISSADSETVNQYLDMATKCLTISFKYSTDTDFIAKATDLITQILALRNLELSTHANYRIAQLTDRLCILPEITPDATELSFHHA